MRKLILSLTLLAGGCGALKDSVTVVGSAGVEADRPEGRAVAKVEVRYTPTSEGTLARRVEPPTATTAAAPSMKAGLPPPMVSQAALKCALSSRGGMSSELPVRQQSDQWARREGMYQALAQDVPRASSDTLVRLPGSQASRKESAIKDANPRPAIVDRLAGAVAVQSDRRPTSPTNAEPRACAARPGHPRTACLSVAIAALLCLGVRFLVSSRGHPSRAQ
jgi:hypothetical protein